MSTPNAQTIQIVNNEWAWPIALESYDRSHALNGIETKEIAFIAARVGGIGSTGGSGGNWPARSRHALERVLRPIEDAVATTSYGIQEKTILVRRQSVVRAMVIEMNRRQSTYWAWSLEDWKNFIQPSQQAFNERLGWAWSENSKPSSGTRTRVALLGYLIGTIRDPRPLLEFKRIEFAQCIFGPERVADAVLCIANVLDSLGYAKSEVAKIGTPVTELLILNRNPFLSTLTVELVDAVHESSIESNRANLSLVSNALVRLGHIKAPGASSRTGPASGHLNANETAPMTWVSACASWYAISTLAPRTKDTYHGVILMVGRWLTDKHPEITSPDQWDALLATKAVAALCSWKTGQYTLRDEHDNNDALKPLRPRSISHYLSALRTFFIDLQASETIPLRFSPQRYFTTPRTVLRKITPNPRVIEKAVWAKLVWAGQNLMHVDIPSSAYPLEMVRAVAAVWLFTALRSDEIARLTVGCIEWPREDIHDTDTGKITKADAVCFLLVPVNKTTGSFRKPISPYVGKMIEAWQEIRPTQPRSLDEKSAEMVDYAFAVRGSAVSKSYINHTLIPLLCKKAGLDLHDQRGPITSHRARATIATYLGNSENPMTLIQLMKWLGHRSPDSTRNYVEADVSKMAVKVAEGSFFQQNLASIPVFIDTDAIKSGAVADGVAWKYFDLGHGLCKLSEWSSCRHRMACAKCDYFEPKDSMRMQLLEANGNLNKMLEFVALGEDERKLVEQGVTINHELLERLQAEPTPSGLTPAEMNHTVAELQTTATVHLVKNEPG